MGITVPESSTAGGLLMLLLLVTPMPLQFPAAAAAANPGFESAWLPSMTCNYDAAVPADAVVKFPCRDIVTAMASAIPHIQRHLGLTDSQLQNRYLYVNLTVLPRLPGRTMGWAIGNRIDLSAEIMKEVGKNCTRREKTLLRSLLTHEMTHVWQGSHQSYATPGGRGFIEGIASYTNFAAGYRRHDECKLPSKNPINVTEWHEGSCATSDFLYFLSMKHPCLVANLTAVMDREIYHDGLFQNLTGKSPGDAWTEFVMAYRLGHFRPQSPFDDPCHPYPISDK